MTASVPVHKREMLAYLWQCAAQFAQFPSQPPQQLLPAFLSRRMERITLMTPARISALTRISPP